MAQAHMFSYLLQLIFIVFFTAFPGVFQRQPWEVEVVHFLLEAGMDIEATEEAGATALYLAAENGQLPVVQCLIDAGADKNAADEAGATALYTAAQYGHAEVVGYLTWAIWVYLGFLIFLLEFENSNNHTSGSNIAISDLLCIFFVFNLMDSFCLL